MSETEVTITQSESKMWWRMEYKGKYEITDEQPSAAECADFRRSTDQMLRANRIEGIAHKRASGNGTLREEPVRN